MEFISRFAFDQISVLEYQNQEGIFEKALRIRNFLSHVCEDNVTFLLSGSGQGYTCSLQTQRHEKYRTL